MSCAKCGKPAVWAWSVTLKTFFGDDYSCQQCYDFYIRNKCRYRKHATLLKMSESKGSNAGPADRIARAVDIVTKYGGIAGDHHKQWVIDQIVRVLLSKEDYEAWRQEMRGEYDSEEDQWEYEDWDEGTAP